MASTWIETHKFYSKLLTICRNVKVPDLSIENQRELFPKLVQTIGHTDFMDQMTQYIDELSLPDDERDLCAPIRVRMGEWYGASANCQPFLAENLALYIQKQTILPDTFFIQKKEIESIQFTRLANGSVEVTIHNKGDQWPIIRTYSLKQRFLLYRFLESCTKTFDQRLANLNEDKGSDYECEPRDTLITPFKEQADSLELMLIGRSYYVLKYFVGMNGEKKKFYTHHTISGNPETLRQDFIESVTKGFVKRFTPHEYPRKRVKSVTGAGYELRRHRHSKGTVRIHICGDIGVVESRPKGAKTSEVFPFCAIILKNGELLMRGNFHEESLLANILT